MKINKFLGIIFLLFVVVNLSVAGSKNVPAKSNPVIKIEKKNDSYRVTLENIDNKTAIKSFEYSDVLIWNWRYYPLIGYLVLWLILFISFGIRKKRLSRNLALAWVVMGEIVALIFFWNAVENFITEEKRTEWLKGLLPIILAAIPGYLLWHWRDVDKKEMLDQGQRDLVLKENDDTWTNFIKYQNIAEDKNNEHSDGVKATAIFALGEYYNREGTPFPNQVHIFFQKFLNDFWDKQEVYKEYLTFVKEQSTSSKMYNKNIEKLKKIKIPEYIEAVHKVIIIKSNTLKSDKKNFFHYKNNLLLNKFNLTRAFLQCGNFSNASFENANLIEANLSKTIFTGANLKEANLCDANLKEANLCDASCRETNLSNAKFDMTNLKGADFYRAILTCAVLNKANLTGTSFVQANLCSTNFADSNFKGEFKLREVYDVFCLKKRILKRSKKNGTTRKKIKFLCLKWQLAAYFTNAKYNNKTNRPKDFDPKRAKMTNIDEVEKKAKPGVKSKVKKKAKAKPKNSVN